MLSKVRNTSSNLVYIFIFLRRSYVEISMATVNEHWKAYKRI